MKLRCVARYRNDARGLAYTDGQVFEVDDTIAAYLLKDAPGCFLVGVADQKAARPTEDKAIKAPVAAFTNTMVKLKLVLPKWVGATVAFSTSS